MKRLVSQKRNEWSGQPKFATWIAKQAHYYECAECGYVYRPSYMTEIMAPCVGKSRKMICPKCEKKCYHKKVVYK